MIFQKHILLDRHFDGMQAFYLNALLRSVVLAMTGIFTPIFVYSTMLPILSERWKAVAAVALYYMIMRVTTGLLAIPSSRIIEKLGFRWSILVSVLFFAGYLGTMLVAAGDYRYLVLAAVLTGVNIPFYWIARNSAIAQDSSTSEVGRQIGFLASLEKAAGILGPVAAGLIIERWGFGAMYAAALVIILISIVPLFSMPHHTHANGVSLKGYWYWIRDRRYFHHAVSTISAAFDDYAVMIVWPLVIVFMGVHYGLLGGVFSLAAGCAIVFRFLSGILFDKLHKKGGFEDEIMYGVAVLGTSAVWVARVFVSGIASILLLDSVGNVFGTTYRNIRSDYNVLGGKRMHQIAYYTYVELTYSVGVLLFCAVLLASSRLGVMREMMFLLTSMWVVFSIVAARESNLK